jgi:hypothetical protein
MDGMEELINQNRSIFDGTLYTIKEKKYPPWNPSSMEGRYSGTGTNAYYFGESPSICWREKQNENPNANLDDYDLFAITIINGTFIDIGAVEGTSFIQSKKEGGWQPTQELSNWFHTKNVLGFRYASQPSIQQGFGGTCFCIYQSSRHLSESDFHRLDIYNALQK